MFWPFSPSPRNVCTAPPSVSCPHPSSAGSPAVHLSSLPLRGGNKLNVEQQQEREWPLACADRGSNNWLTVAVHFGLQVIDNLSLLLEIWVCFMELLPANHHTSSGFQLTFVWNPHREIIAEKQQRTYKCSSSFFFSKDDLKTTREMHYTQN